jgi:hypothetical protein
MSLRIKKLLNSPSFRLYAWLCLKAVGCTDIFDALVP